MTYFQVCDNYDHPFDDPAAPSYTSLGVAGRWTTLESALRAATKRALQLAEDSSTGAYSVDVSMHLETNGGGMTVASVHIWNDHDPQSPWLTALRTHLDAGQLAA